MTVDWGATELNESNIAGTYHVSKEERNNAIRRAENEGFEVIHSAPNLLLLDFDVPFHAHGNCKVYNADVMDLLRRDIGVVEERSWASKSGNTHFLVTLAKELPAPHRIALQAALGSDPKREALSVLRLLNGIEEPSLLFKPKAKP